MRCEKYLAKPDDAFFAVPEALPTRSVDGAPASGHRIKAAQCVLRKYLRNCSNDSRSPALLPAEQRTGGWRETGMSFQKTPAGTRGAGSNAIMRAIMRVMTSWHRRSGDKFQGMDLLYLTTVGAKSGEKRQSTVTRFADGEGAWLVVASAGGSAHHPAWY